MDVFGKTRNFQSKIFIPPEEKTRRKKNKKITSVNDRSKNVKNLNINLRRLCIKTHNRTENLPLPFFFFFFLYSVFYFFSFQVWREEVIERPTVSVMQLQNRHL